jgi:hypothetical protein
LRGFSGVAATHRAFRIAGNERWVIDK